MRRRCCYLPPFPDSSPRFTGDGWILESRGKFSSFFLLPLFFLFFLSAHWILVGRDLFPISRTRIISLFSLSLSAACAVCLRFISSSFSRMPHRTAADYVRRRPRFTNRRPITVFSPTKKTNQFSPNGLGMHRRGTFHFGRVKEEEKKRRRKQLSNH